MKLATLADGTRDGVLAVVSRDLTRCDVFHGMTMQRLLDNWDGLVTVVAARARALEEGGGVPFDVRRCRPPLPRAYEWVDGSAYLNHVRLVRKARGAEMPPSFEVDPLVYQGGSSMLLAPTEAIPAGDPSWGLDFEGEVCVVLDDTPIGTNAASALDHIRLIGLVNDVTLRNLIPGELAKGFGFFQSKPATAFSPVFVTPDELGGHWRDGRVWLRLRVEYNGTLVGDCEAGPEMQFGFHELVQHISLTRAFGAGTLLGSGTVSNADRARGISCLAERRMIEVIEGGAATTPFMKAGDTIRIEMVDTEGQSIFGAIDQEVR
jgi:fumarylacetoacetate (FAA) hydrolase